jgi:protein involved in polysaccharide export with SLBB domain
MNPAMGWIDPSEVGRYKKDPLIRPILDRLTSGIDEPTVMFAQATDPKPEDLIVTPRDYSIGKGDLLAVSITDLVGPQVETLKQMRVSETGKISLPLIGQIQAEGLTEAQLEVAIQQAYADASLIAKAQVSVTVIEARNRTFSIAEAVNAPGQYAIINSDFRLLDALVLARGVSNPTADYIYIYRKTKSDEPHTGGATTAPAAAPGTAPSNDMLAPKSEATMPNKPVYLQTTGADATAPAAPATTTPAEDQGRFIIIDGKPVLVQGTKPATSQTPAANEAAPTTPAPTTPAPSNPTEPVAPTPAQHPTTPAVTSTPTTPNVASSAAPAATSAPGTFEFNELQEPTDVRVIKVPYQALKNGELKYNIVIRSQDMIVVPQPVIGEYYMGGHVLRTGVYSLTGRNISLKQAVIAAGMLDQVAIPEQTSLVRRIGGDKEVYCRVDLAAIFAGEQPDIFLKPDDQVMVGTNALAPFVAAIRGAFRITYGFGFLYDRNFAPNNGF